MHCIRTHTVHQLPHTKHTFDRCVCHPKPGSRAALLQAPAQEMGTNKHSTPHPNLHLLNSLGQRLHALPFTNCEVARAVLPRAK
jgi:hypothetical protein